MSPQNYPTELFLHSINAFSHQTNINMIPFTSLNVKLGLLEDLIFAGFYLSGKVLALPHTAPIKPAPPSERLDANFARISFY